MKKFLGAVFLFYTLAISGWSQVKGVSIIGIGSGGAGASVPVTLRITDSGNFSSVHYDILFSASATATSAAYSSYLQGLMVCNNGDPGFTFNDAGNQVNTVVRTVTVPSASFSGYLITLAVQGTPPVACSSASTSIVYTIGGTATPTSTTTNTFTRTPTNTVTATFTRTFTNTLTNTPTATLTPTLTFTNTTTSTATRTFTNTVTNTATPTVTKTPITTDVSTNGKVGTTAGWVINAANNLGVLFTLPASQTNSTLVIPVSCLTVGDILTKFGITGGITSAGGGVTLTANLRCVTANTADSSIASMSVTVTSSAPVNSNNMGVTFTPKPIVSGDSYYILVTCGNAASTAVTLNGGEIFVIKQAY